MSETPEVKTLDVSDTKVGTDSTLVQRDTILAVRQKGKRGKWATRACKIDELIASGKDLIYRII